MFFIFKKNNFVKKIYPIFYENLTLAKENDNAVILLDSKELNLTIMVIINFNVIIFKKKQESKITSIKLTFNKEFNNPTENIYSLIKQTKHEAHVVKNYAFIEHFSEMLNKVLVLYKIDLLEQHFIWKEIFCLDLNFFNSSSCISLPKESDNKWID